MVGLRAASDLATQQDRTNFLIEEISATAQEQLAVTQAQTEAFIEGFLLCRKPLDSKPVFGFHRDEVMIIRGDRDVYYRGIEQLLHDWSDVRQILKLKKVPDHSTLRLLCSYERVDRMLWSVAFGAVVLERAPRSEPCEGRQRFR